MNKIIKDRGSVYCNEGAWEALTEIITEINPSRIFVLSDENTHEHCIPRFENKLDIDQDFIHISIPEGEAHKNIHSCLEVWEKMSKLGADRNSLLINVGGGVVTDLGGFVACTYQRGIEFINIPTSLLAMVDASVGGKTGVDLGSLKNQIGIIRNPKVVVVDTTFLQTLPKAHFDSGVAEMLKHGLIHSEDYLRRVMNMDPQDAESLESLVWESIVIKNDVITEDPLEKGLRKTLNYGHTLGHAIESYFLENDDKETLLHGEAIAIGMILANYISEHYFDFPSSLSKEFADYIKEVYGSVSFTQHDISQIIKLLIFDKKNSHGKIQFVLLTDVGVPKLNCIVEDDVIYAAFSFYAQL